MIRYPFKLFISVAAATTLFGCSLLDGNLSSLGSMSPSEALSVGQDLYKAVDLSDEEVVNLSHQVAVESDSTNQLAEPTSTYSKRLVKLVANHKKEDGLKLNYKVYISDELNAFSLADGTIRVNSALMDMLSDQELIAVIGHEIGHVKLGHSKSQLQRSYAASAALKATGSQIRSGVGGTAGGVVGAIGASALAEITASILEAQFSQSDELEADQYSIGFLKKHDYNPRGLIIALSKFREIESEEDPGFMAQFVSSHPNAEARIEQLEVVLAQNKETQSGAEPVDTQAVSDEQGDLQTDSSVAAKEEENNHKQAAKTKSVERMETAHHESAAEPVQQATFLGEEHDESVKIAHHQPELEPVQQTTYFVEEPEEGIEPIRNVEPIRKVEPAHEVESVSDFVAPTPGWYIQLAAFKKQQEANKMRDDLFEQNVKAKIQVAEVNGAEYRRILVGPYASKQEARTEAARVSSHGIYSGEPFIRRLPQ